MASPLDLSSDDEMFAVINVTPLVDVVLVLLIIFMITAPAIYQQAIQVQLPKAKSGEDAGSRSPLSFTLTREGNLSMGKEALSWDALPARLAALLPRGRAPNGEESNQTAVISADQATPHGTVIRLMDALREAGLTRFALSVEGTSR